MARSAFTRLAAMSARDVLRERTTGFAPLFLFVWLLVLYAVLSLMLPNAAAEAATHPLRRALPGILVAGIAGIAFMATSVPLVSMRERGLLRLLGTTPLPTGVFLLAQAPVRCLIVTLLVCTAWGVAVVSGFSPDDADGWRLACSAGIGAAMLTACAFVLAARGRSADTTHQAAVVLTLGVMVCSGSFIPLPAGALPVFVEALPRMLPTYWFASAVGSDLTGAEPELPIPVIWSIMLAVTAAAAAVARRRFLWDREADAPLGSTALHPAPVPTDLERR